MSHPHLYTNVDIYQKPFPKFGRPLIIGYIGLENLKYARSICDKKVEFDLNKRINEVKRKPPDLDVKLNDLLSFLLKNEIRLNFMKSNNFESALIFCYRGLMTCVACTPYENDEPWKIVALLYQGNIYLCARDTEEKKARKNNMSEKDKLFTSWGFKFEQYMLSDKPDMEPNPDAPVDETEEFSLVFTTNLKNHKIVYGAEMDGIRCDNKKIDTINICEEPDHIIKYLLDKKFVELKTNRHIEFANQDRNFRRFKAKKWWCQSFLAGVETIVCGFRNDNGIVDELKVYKVADLPKMCRKFWDPSVCLNFLETFFTFVKRCLSREVKQKYGDKASYNLHALPLISLLFEWSPGSPVQVSNYYNHDDDPILSEMFLKTYGKNIEMK
ncbi:decapping and exoribonuclease protein-like [Zerene cesonia]|uniref:decapping and exoribonuclease protein-like n=1 Tax=Zerene cesonia TaxID=33412 RepID=UPI0018E50CEA|nr:decapping and exoribonuclease protein-like [Zerene cesonia]XP_038209380.1 decapping and exoribonuclease protein-like [Zerene cesonia]XP_038209381.1 decapping and exoribonuclease protein-like [Zerene cesonia]